MYPINFLFIIFMSRSEVYFSTSVFFYLFLVHLYVEIVIKRHFYFKNIATQYIGCCNPFLLQTFYTLINECKEHVFLKLKCERIWIYSWFKFYKKGNIRCIKCTLSDFFRSNNFSTEIPNKGILFKISFTFSLKQCMHENEILICW